MPALYSSSFCRLCIFLLFELHVYYFTYARLLRSVNYIIVIVIVILWSCTRVAAKVVLFSVVSVCVLVCLSVCLSVNTIAPEPLEISSRNFQGTILWSKGWTSSKMTL